MLKVNVSARWGGALVSIEGRLDTENWEECEKRLQPVVNSKPKSLTLDLALLDFISSMGIRTIIKLRKAVEEQGGKVLLMNMQPQIQKVFEITAALPKERIFASVQEADRYFAAIQKRELSGDED